MMQLTNKKSEYEIDPVISLKQLFYPDYLPGASEQEFLTYYEPMFEQLRKLDIIGEQEFKKLAIYTPSPNGKFNKLEKLIEVIVDGLNDLCTFCHRKELRVKISIEQIGYQKNLKGVPIGRRPILVSHWEKSFLPLNTGLDSIEQSLKPTLTSILDKIYIEHRRIPNYYLLFMGSPELLVHLYQFEEKLVLDSLSDKTSLPLVHKFYLGVIAASTYGSGYMWNLMVGSFLRHGGDPKWIETGLDELPESLRKFSQASYQMAYEFNINILEQLSFELGKIVEDSAILEGFYILSYYQFLAGVSLAFGLVPESKEFDKLYLKGVAVKPSPESFQTMKILSRQQNRYEHEMAREFQEMYSWEQHSEKQNFKRVEMLVQKKSPSKKLIEKGRLSEPLKQTFYESQRMIAIEEEEMIMKLKASKTMSYIERVFSKYVEFDKRRSLVEFKKKANKKTRVSNSANDEGDSNDSNSSAEDDEFIYASEWNFETHTSPLMEWTVSLSFYKITCELLGSLRSIESTKSKNMKMYYESLQNYMHEYIIKKINEGLTQVEKNYIKLLTRSPFLFNERSFLKMKEDLESVCKICEPFKFGLEVFSFKLELSMALTSYAYERYIDDK